MMSADHARRVFSSLARPRLSIVLRLGTVLIVAGCGGSPEPSPRSTTPSSIPTSSSTAATTTVPANTSSVATTTSAGSTTSASSTSTTSSSSSSSTSTTGPSSTTTSVLVLVPNFTVSLTNGTVIPEGTNIQFSGGANYFLSLNASSSTPQSAGLSYLWSLVNSGGELIGTTSQTASWAVGCGLAGNSSFTLTIRLTVSASGASSASATKAWPVVVNRCGT